MDNENLERAIAQIYRLSQTLLIEGKKENNPAKQMLAVSLSIFMQTAMEDQLKEFITHVVSFRMVAKDKEVEFNIINDYYNRPGILN